MDETPRGSDEVDLNKSLQEVLKSAARNDGLARGLRGKIIHSYSVQFFHTNIFRIGQSFRST
jgi:hypothetical protein